jgi:exopolyphosphatase/guanosine-5'-triphosphate,3'-diphosphate pyrophosphatase
MEPIEKPAEKAAAAPPAKTVAAIDVGSNALRMVVAEVDEDGRIDVLEQFQRASRMGQDTFRRSRLGAESMRAAVAVMRDYKRRLELYKVERVRAVATSAVREAANGENFLDRVYLATGLNVEMIGTPEESRLTVSAVLSATGDTQSINRGEALIVDAGGGSTLLTLLENGEITNSVALRLGSVRLQEVLAASEEPPDRSAELLRYHIASAISDAQRLFSLGGTRLFVAVGGDARFAAHQVGKPTESADLYAVARDDFDKLVRRCERLTPEELSRRYGLPFAEAETLSPALLIYQRLLHETQAAEMIVSHVSMRDGLLLELARNVTGEQDDTIMEGVIHSAVALGKKYRVDPVHAENVTGLAVRLFDELKADHGLGPRHRLLLRVAGLLHEAGGFVSNVAHHKHSYYLIRNSEIFGLSRAEIETVALIARYHRRSAPKSSHLEYISLARETRVVVNKLAAILRVADALGQGPPKKVDSLRFERQGDELVVRVPCEGNLTLEQRSLADKGDLFEDVFGMPVRLEEA